MKRMYGIPVFCIAVLLLLTACKAENDSAGTSPEQETASQTEDLFRFAVKTEGGELAPARAAFLLSVDQVLGALGLTEENVDYSLGEEKPRIIDYVSVEDLSDEIQETFSFEGDLLVSVQYAFQIGADETEQVCRLLSGQAETSMPSELLRGENEILKQGTTYWDDEAQDMVMLSFADTGDSGVKAVVLQLSVSRARAAAAVGSKP